MKWLLSLYVYIYPVLLDNDPWTKICTKSLLMSKKPNLQCNQSSLKTDNLVFWLFGHIHSLKLKQAPHLSCRGEFQGFHINKHALKGQLKVTVTYPWQNLHVVQSILCFQGWLASIVRYKTAACQKMKKTPMSHTWLSYWITFVLYGRCVVASF